MEVIVMAMTVLIFIVTGLAVDRLDSGTSSPTNDEGDKDEWS